MTFSKKIDNIFIFIRYIRWRFQWTIFGLFLSLFRGKNTAEELLAKLSSSGLEEILKEWKLSDIRQHKEYGHGYGIYKNLAEIYILHTNKRMKNHLKGYKCDWYNR